MKERPVLFNGEMVRAILDGRKTQTRRILVTRPTNHYDGFTFEAGKHHPHIVRGGMTLVSSEGISCPFGLVGDRLWVRETWGVVSHDFDENERIIDWVPDRPARAIHEMPFGNGYYSGHAIYAADGEFTWGDDDGHGEKSCWKPSIHMPRSACRLVLEITDVRVERLNSISEEDALAEGIRRTENNFGNGPAYCDYMLANLNDVAEWYNRPSDSFISLWQSIYGAESWQHSPWVWVIEFKRVEAHHEE